MRSDGAVASGTINPLQVPRRFNEDGVTEEGDLFVLLDTRYGVTNATHLRQSDRNRMSNAESEGKAGRRLVRLKGPTAAFELSAPTHWKFGTKTSSDLPGFYDCLIA